MGGPVPAPEAHLDLATCHLTLLGTVPGFAPDGDRVHDAVVRDDPAAVALGIPQEDLEALHALRQDPGRREDLPPLDDVDARFVEVLERFGAVQVVPSPDLEAAFAAERPLHAIDLDDAAHTDLYTRRMKVRHLVQRSSVHRKLLKRDFAAAEDAWDLARRWDRGLAKVKPLGAIESDREAHMAWQAKALAERYPRLLVVVPAARFDGVLSRLDASSSQS